MRLKVSQVILLRTFKNPDEIVLELRGRWVSDTGALVYRRGVMPTVTGSGSVDLDLPIRVSLDVNAAESLATRCCDFVIDLLDEAEGVRA